MGDSQSANLSSGKDRKIGSHHSRVKTRLQRCSHVTSREPRRIVVTGVQLRTGSRRTHRRTPHPHNGQCGRTTELGAARREEAEEEAHKKQLYHGLVGAGASSSPAASSAHVRAAAPPWPRGHACKQLRSGLTSARRGRPRWWLTRWGARMGSSCSARAGREGRAEPVVRATSRRWAMELWPWAMELRRAVSHLGAGAERRS